MFRVCRLLALICAVAACSAAHAQSARFELTPFVGYRLGGSFDIASDSDSGESVDLDPAASYGIGFGVYRDNQSFYELLYSRQQASLDSNDASLANVDVDIEYFQVGGTALFETAEQWMVPYLSLTIGATRLSPQQGGYDDETKFSGSIGGGLRMPFNERVAATFGLRGYLTLVDSDTGIFCLSDATGATCLLRTSGSTIFQGEALLGLTVRF